MYRLFKNKDKDINIENYLIKIGKAAKQNQINRSNVILEMILNEETECISSITSDLNIPAGKDLYQKYFKPSSKD